MPPTAPDNECPKLLYAEEVARLVAKRLRISRTKYYTVHHEALKPMMRERTGSSKTLLASEAHKYINLCLQHDLEKAQAWAWAEAEYSN